MRLSTKKLTEKYQPGLCFVETSTGREVAYLTMEALEDAAAVNGQKVRDAIFESVIDVIEHYIPNLTSEEIKFVNSCIPRPVGT